MAPTVLDVGFSPDDGTGIVTIAALDRTLRVVQRMAYQTAAHSLGRVELTTAQHRDFELVIVDIHHSNLWVLLGTLAQAAVDTAVKAVVENAIQPLLKRLGVLLQHPEAHSPIDAATLTGLVTLTRVAGERHVQIHLETGGMHFVATPLDHARLASVPTAYRGDMIEMQGVVSEISLKRNTLTLDLLLAQASIICRFTPAQALVIRNVWLLGQALTVRGRGMWTGEQLDPTRPDLVEIEQIFNPQGESLALPPVLVQE